MRSTQRPVFRLREQVEQLKRDKWWMQSLTLISDHIRLCQRLASAAISEYEFAIDQKKIPGFIDTLDEVVPHIYPLVKASTAWSFGSA
jgi:hypothetical protein